MWAQRSHICLVLRLLRAHEPHSAHYSLQHPCMPLSCLLACRTPVDAPPCTMPLAGAMPRAWRRCWRLVLILACPTCVLPNKALTSVVCMC